ncbi:glycosyl hydrolase family 115 (putative glucuronidase) [Mucilaginibacter frigoritolerans]|uniref:Glycosyl hydrolase family 115 (Putative glucuronidase) n=1 Tax=Mucilaginibacter frigoritolerans TaxID=652788 RepID=A0A562U864_9SPHI|nr:glycosyl hydrolase 115 family protein [Mucilaginibacter frigoritolerans]TWJ01627.1 glycosyl hydrolase family 115 (putative glucuronidase) [Mucilaginibacter frigoritolerans]
MKSHFSLIALALFITVSTAKAQTPGTASYISVKDAPGYFRLSADGLSAPLCSSETEYPGVIRAIKSLQTDIKYVTNAEPQLITGNPTNAKQVVIIGTIGKSALIDKLIKFKKLNVSTISGKWEAHITQVVQNPLPGVSKALVIVGSDKRGTIYGIYDLSAQIGVSPWYWWADVPVKQQNSLYVLPGAYTDGEPKVKYRGIFINDEAPAFSGWTKEKFGGVNHLVYEKMFELILRLKGNYLWPAMWGNAFNDDDKLDPALADEYGIVMGTSHHEPMDRAQQEWKRCGTGAWNYDTNGPVLRDFWKKGIENMGTKETIVTVGMRGDGDMPMTEGSNIKLLEKIVSDQRQIIADVTGKDASKTPQMWALYKEVQDYYDKGMRVPDDVTLLLCDDNWGNIRKLPKSGEQPRKGGYGIYYHFDYVGGPRNYKWLNTNPISKTWEQMHLAYEYGAKQVWVVNVGDLKPMEFPISFFLDYAWNPDKWPAARLDEYTKLWAAQQFGPQYSSEIARILTLYTKYNSRRKPELLDQNTYSLTDYREFETVVNEYNKLRNEAQQLNDKIDPKYKDAYYQLVLHPVEACSNLNELYFAAAKNKLYAIQGRAATNIMADSVKQLYAKDSAISHYYNKVMANGKWDHMMDQTHIGYTYWQEPRVNKVPNVTTIDLPATPQMGVAIEGSAAWWPQEQAKAILPEFSAGGKSHYIEIFNRGQGSFDFTATSAAPFVSIKPQSGHVSNQQRLWINIDWAKVPTGIQHIPLTITEANGDKIIIEAVINNTIPANTPGFHENNGYMSIEAEHYTKAVNGVDVKWVKIPDYGRTLSGMMPSPVTAKNQQPGGNSPRLEYEINLVDTGVVKVETYISPTIDFTNTSGLHYAISIDDEQPQLVNINADKSEAAWSKDVSNNIKVLVTSHHIAKPGRHVLKYWMVNPAVVLQKIVVNAGGEKPSYLGPPESYWVRSPL